MKNNIKQLALAAVIATGVSSINASAATLEILAATAGNTYEQNFGFGATLGGPDALVYGTPEPTTHYSDFIEFVLTSPSSIIVFAKNLSSGFAFDVNPLDTVPVIDLKDSLGNYILKNHDHAALNPAADGSYSYYYPNIYSDYIPLAAGKYTVNFNYGPKVTSLTGGTYTGGITVAAVPEPETYAMMLAGLGLIGFSARRRKTQA
ncbi:MAG TPA: FxDxF family PEP-CTERM protein [Methylotenera sp.]|jgi:hypothetical protein|nr:FxDxF family PEP-CTERM protein [Methylotenera sp.]HPV31237.1 FxDxF family PEP-CTERM protein [Methylotenera sp.]